MQTYEQVQITEPKKIKNRTVFAILFFCLFLLLTSIIFTAFTVQVDNFITRRHSLVFDLTLSSLPPNDLLAMTKCFSYDVTPALDFAIEHSEFEFR